MSDFPALIQLGNYDGYGFSIHGEAGNDNAGISVSSAGDFNGDGFEDFLVGAVGNDSGGGSAGAAYLIFGQAAHRGQIELASLGAANGFKIQGDVAMDLAGRGVSSAGDINGDGFDDIIIGAAGNDSGGYRAGAAYVLYGKASGFGAVDLGSLDAADGFKIQGDSSDDYSGYSVSSAGDVNGDGFDDMLVGADREDSSTGAAYLIFGKAGGFTGIDLSGLAAADGFKILSEAVGDRAGRSVSSAGDVNNDGFDDIIIGALGNSNSGGQRAGAAYLLFGKADGFGTVALASLAPADGFKILGDNPYDIAGVSVSSAGDVNGDGFDDMLVGADGPDGPEYNSGAAYVIFGKAEGFGTIELSGLDPADGFKIRGDSIVGHSTGWSVSTAGDVNGDGFDDIILGAPGDEGGGTDAGAAYLIFGKASGFTQIDLANLAVEDGFKLQGRDSFDLAGWSVSSAGDVNGDGFDDMLVGAPGGFYSPRFEGAAYVVYGIAPTSAVTRIGAGGDQTIRGGVGDDFLDGAGGDDRLFGAGGNDTLQGGIGADSMTGGIGNDIYYVDDALDQMLEAVNEGSDEIRTFFSSYSIFCIANVENLTGLGSGGQTLTGNAAANLIDGGLGPDSMIGGLGDDAYLVDDAGDTVTELAGEGIDELRTAFASFSLAGFANVENLAGTAATGQTLIGNDLGNGIVAGGGNDTLDGGLGADAMFGGLGDDIFLADDSGDTINEGEEQGSDEVRTTAASFSLAGFANVEHLTGGSADQSLTGNGWNNVIDGGAGADAMAGAGGHDIYIVDDFGDSITEIDGAGTDEVRTALGAGANVYVLPNFVENLIGTSSVAQSVAGNALANIIFMGNGNDLILLDAGGDDIVSGGAGNDFFYYGSAWTAADQTVGGIGADTIGLLGSTAITLAATSLIGIERLALYTGLPGAPATYSITTHDENVASGAELLVTAASLTAEETLTFNGSAEAGGRFTVHGGAGGDLIVGGGGGDFFIGNGGNDSLYGLGGQDFLIGGLGADLLRGGAGGDRFLYQSTAQSTAGSTDRIVDFQHVDRIDLTAIDANGNGADGDSAFTFIGANAFTNTAGQLRAYQLGADWFVEGDVDGDGLADLLIQVTLPDATPLGVGDFYL